MRKELMLVFVVCFYSSICFAQMNTKKPFEKIAKKESLIPVHPGVPGKIPFWNKYATRFIYAPAFDYKLIGQAARYSYRILCLPDSQTYSFESNVPYAPLSPVWGKMPVGYFNIKVFGISSKGDTVGLSGSGHYYHASFFNGPYHHEVLPYDSSALVALDSLYHRSYVNYWLEHKVPDTSYWKYQYAAKMFSSLITGAITYAKLTSNVSEAKRALKIAHIVADYLLKISFKKGSKYEYLPPTYYGKGVSESGQKWIRVDNCMPMYGARAGNAYLNLYNYTGNKKYLYAAERIARTYLKTQLEIGSWYSYVNPITGQPTEQNIGVPMKIISYLTRLQQDYKMKRLYETIKKALRWVMTNPVKTFNWQAQFEDMGTYPPYKDLSKTQVCALAIYLFRNSSSDASKMKLAEELVRFAEDQFVIWENPGKQVVDINNNKSYSRWVLPSVQEQYLFWVPIIGSATTMIETYWYAYVATKKKIYLAKAKSLANALMIAQKLHKGIYPTCYYAKYPAVYSSGHWINGVIVSAQVMATFADNLKRLSAISQ